MASKFSRTNFLLSVITIMCILQFSKCIYCTEFEVGEIGGWVVPHENETKNYNDWASRRRFKVGDTIRFNYRKDSVMEVSKPDYKECDSTHPILFANSGNTVFTLDRAGFFYFISGTTGHCQKGQRLIVWVMAQEGTGGTSHATNNGFFSYGLFVITVAFQYLYFA